ncbi:fimbrial protein [Pseudomonas sp.]|uniref:fimbrial protein n=1 Tax=Pseudomonas sp. TaxID=306 RepID=UPI00261715FA|nr:fimbrial protein [Pseudomonas sp.]
MKYLAGILFLLVMQTADATQCRINGGTWLQVGPTWDIRVNVKATPGAGLIDLDGYQLECRYQPGPTTPNSDYDVMSTRSVGLTPGAKFVGHKMGLLISGRRHAAPIFLRTHMATLPNNGNGVDLKTNMYMSLQGLPGKPINILAGDLLGTLLIGQVNNLGIPGNDMTVNIIAQNGFILEPSTCTINGNNPIDVDFDQVDPLTIGDSPLSSTVQKTVTLNYSCPDPNITLPITITLKGAPASFNTDSIAMSHADLGTGLIRRGVVVGPGKSFTTNLHNSVGSDDVTFSLIRKPGSYPDAGVYTGSATLVMGVP